MDRAEAREILAKELESFRSMDYERLRELEGENRALDRMGQSGTSYQIEIEVLWDDPLEGKRNLRVIASIDDGSFLASLFPLTSDFIMAPDGKVIPGD
ncbi:MAG: hypothetical protein R3191_05975 [Anaerolineales bacterium]|nr:hypothetical protein [Anaerolineales bacterium]